MGAMTCKIKHFLALVLSVGITSLIFCFLGKDQNVNLQHLVTQTHKHFETLKENLHVGSGEKRLEVEDKYLNLLGFSPDANSEAKSESYRPNYSTDELTLSSKNGSLPIVIISSVNRNQLNQVFGFIRNVHLALPSNPIVLWNMDVSGPTAEETEFSTELKHYCNSSLCGVESFNYEDYPEHVKDQSLRAYRPIIVQTMLYRGGCILWLDVDRRLINFGKETLDRFLTLALDGGSHGIIGWSTSHPTSTLTHPKMFPYFDTKAENYYFHRMIDPAQLLVCSTNQVLTKVMLPWVKCSLTKDCISPFGAQSGGCRFDKKPLYRYSGCHAYDSSALNVALGLAFPLHQPYISRAIITRSVQVPVLNHTIPS